MTGFVDASVLVAILGEEPDHERHAADLDAVGQKITSAIAIWEASVALARITATSFRAAERDVRAFLTAQKVTVVPLDEREATYALDAHDRFGKGRHPARLNMGDCFAYACAKAHDARLLYKGDDFARTDLA